MKGARVEYVKKGKGRFFLVTSAAILALQCNTDEEMHEWISEMHSLGAMFSSYPSSLEMLKKLPTGNEQIQCMTNTKGITLLGCTDSVQIRTVDTMVCSSYKMFCSC